MSMKDDIGEELLASLESNAKALAHLKRVDETTFRNVLLPIALAVHSNQSPQTGPWVYYAGSAQLGVVVVDGLGNELFTTPSLYQTVNLRITTNWVSLQENSARNKEVGGDGSRAFETHINASNAIVTTAPDVSKAPILWAGIFSRYGYRMVSTKAAPEAKATIGVASNPMDGTNELI